MQAKHIVITGGTSGIGLELVKQLHPENKISVVARPSERLEDLAKNFDGIAIYEADLSDPEAVEKTGKALVATSRKIDILINNAAEQYTPHFLDEEFDSAYISREINVNFTAPALLISTCLPALNHDGEAVILNINSGLGLVPKTSSAIYCGTKGAINIFSQSLRNQLEDTNIRVMQAFLPLVETKMTTGRGTGKISASDAAAKIIAGMKSGKDDIDIGKVKLLRWINHFAPALARSIMKKS